MTRRGCLLIALLAAVTSFSAAGQIRLQTVSPVLGLTADRSEEIDSWVGVQLGFDMPFDLRATGTIALRPSFPDDPAGNWRGTAFRGYGVVRATPIPGLDAVSFGIGFASDLSWAREPDRDLRASHASLVPLAVLGVRFRVWRLVPFLDVYAVDPIPSPQYTGIHVLAGLGFAL